MLVVFDGHVAHAVHVPLLMYLPDAHVHDVTVPVVGERVNPLLHVHVVTVPPPEVEYEGHATHVPELFL